MQTKIIQNCWDEWKIQCGVEKIESDYLEKEVIAENTTGKFIINIGDDLNSSESDCDEGNSGSGGMFWCGRNMCQWTIFV